ncbi:RPS6, partial [Symbiodinium sp. CCMP2592]
GMRKTADRAYTLLENLQISDSDMNGILKLYLATSPPDAWATACQWLLANEALWSGWVPDERTCLEGKGLVDLNGNFVDAKVAAVGCTTCPVGYFSEEIADITGTTRKCSPCPLGTSQP